MNTMVYVDGFSFYYGCLKAAACGEINLVELFRDCLLPASAGRLAHLQCVHYFTSPHAGGFLEQDHAQLRVWRMSERQADVRMGLELLQDALYGRAQQLVLCTLDEDLVPALEMVRKSRPDCRIGLIVPTLSETRRAPPALKALADWCRATVTIDELLACVVTEVAA